VEIAGITAKANGLWMDQIGRNVTDSMDDLLNGKRYMIHDRDPLFTGEFLDIPVLALSPSSCRRDHPT
jgi:hypothetical protein